MLALKLGFKDRARKLKWVPASGRYRSWFCHWLPHRRYVSMLLQVLEESMSTLFQFGLLDNLKVAPQLESIISMRLDDGLPNSGRIIRYDPMKNDKWKMENEKTKFLITGMVVSLPTDIRPFSLGARVCYLLWLRHVLCPRSSVD